MGIHSVSGLMCNRTSQHLNLVVVPLLAKVSAGTRVEKLGTATIRLCENS